MPEVTTIPVHHFTGFTLPDQTAASPAVSGGRIYVRGYEYLWAIGEK